MCFALFLLGQNLSPALAVQDGSDATNNSFVVPIYTEESKDFHNLCSGALLAPAIVATAGHCVLDANGLLSSDIRVGNAGSENYNSQPLYDSWVRASSVQITSTFKKEASISADDIVFIILTKPLPMPIKVRLASEAEVLMMKNSSAELKLLGYGKINEDGVEKKRPNSFTGTFGKEFYADANAFGVHSTVGNLCKGDSGGPILNITATEVVVVGIMTGGRIAKNCTTKEPEGYFLTQGMLLSRYSNLAFSAAVTYIAEIESKLSKAQGKLRSNITCTKGTSTKTLSGANSKCPAGYKKVG